MAKFKVECCWTENHSGEFVIDAVNKKEVIEYLKNNPKRLNYTQQEAKLCRRKT